MTHGKRTCKILKEIRQQIADKNDIEYVTSECHFQGECQGTCPKCEAEVQFLENELSKRRQLGKAVAVAGIATVSLGMAMTTLSSCNQPEAVCGYSDEEEAITEIPIMENDTLEEKRCFVGTLPIVTAEVGFIETEPYWNDDTTKLDDTTKNPTKTEEIKVIEEKSEEK